MANTTNIYVFKGMYTEILKEIGLSPNEAKIYETLIKIGQSSVPEISLNSGVHKRNSYDTIPRLLKKGIIYQVAHSKENIYAAVEPSKLRELVREKEEKLNEILPALNKEFKKTATHEAVYIYKGVEGFKNYLREILTLKYGEEVYLIGAKGGWFDPRLQTFLKKFLKTANAKKIKYHHIFDYEVKEQAPEILKDLGTSYRYFPKGYSTTAAIDIFGDRLVTFSGLHLRQINDDITLAVIVNQELANSYKTWFKFMWDHCPK